MSEEKPFLSLLRHYDIYKANLDIIRTLRIQTLPSPGPLPSNHSAHQLELLHLM